MSKFNNCFVVATEKNYKLLLKEGLMPEYRNVLENGIAWKGCFYIEPYEGKIVAQGNWEYNNFKEETHKFTELVNRSGIWYKVLYEEF